MLNDSCCKKGCDSDSDSDDFANLGSITIADGTKEDFNAGMDEEAMKEKIWSRMRPPKIGSAIPAVKIDRLEKTRLLLNEACEIKDNLLGDKVESLIELQKDSEGNIIKTVSKKTVTVFPSDSHIQKKVCAKPNPTETASKSAVPAPPVIPTPQKKKCCPK